MTTPQRLLHGLRVLDAASFIAAPAATTVMADFGADVIKIEPPEGDGLRALFKQPGYPPSEVDYCWLVDNRNKRGIIVDLKRDEGRDVLYRLVRSADVFVTNMPLDARRRLKVRYADLKPLNRRLVYGSITAYGETGAEADRPGFDSTALWARSGLMDWIRPAPDAPPARSVPGMGDHPTGLALFGAIMAALYHRERTGEGTMVSTSLMANGLWWNAIPVQAMLLGHRFAPRPPRDQTSNALTNMYRCRDGRWFMLVLLSEDRDWKRLAAAIGRSELLSDARFATASDRHDNARALTAALDATFAQKDLAEWRAILEAHRLTYGVVETLTDIPHDRQMRDSGALIPLDDAGLAGTLTVASPVWLDGHEKVPPRRAPRPGEHTVDVLREAGFSRDEIDRLLDAGVIG